MQISHIIKKYDEKTVVNDVSFSLPKGKVTSLIGPNGAGKSTVMSIISRLIAADNGSVVIEKKDINKWNSRSQCMIGKVRSLQSIWQYLHRLIISR